MLIAVSFLSVLGLGTPTYSNNVVYGTAQFDGYYDANGHQVAYDNQTAVSGGDAGQIDRVTIGTQGAWSALRYWRNGTSTSYQVWTTPNSMDESETEVTFNMASSIGLIGIIIAVMAITTIMGIKFFGTGISNATQIFAVTVLLTLWGVFSAISIALIGQIPLGLGYGFYFFMTLLYCVGIVQTTGGIGDDL